MDDPVFRKLDSLQLPVPDLDRCAVVANPFGNTLVLLDTSKGTLVTDDDGVVVGVEPIAD